MNYLRYMNIPEESLLVLLGPVDVETLQTSFHPNRKEIYIRNKNSQDKLKLKISQQLQTTCRRCESSSSGKKIIPHHSIHCFREINFQRVYLHLKKTWLIKAFTFCLDLIEKLSQMLICHDCLPSMVHILLRLNWKTFTNANMPRLPTNMCTSVKLQQLLDTVRIRQKC
jgi:hypothetical protein